MKILVDTNVLLDVAQQRQPFLADSDAVVRWCEVHPGQGFVAWHSISNLYFILRKPLGEVASREFVAMVLEIFEVVATGTASAKLALRLQMGDLEDALQTAAAIEAGADVIVTRDRDYQAAPIPVQTPGEFLASLTP